MLCTVLVEARLLWWGDTPWLGWALAGCIPFYTAALLIEKHRANPLLRLSWYGTSTIATFAAVAVVVRLALSEQSYGAVGLISYAGLINDQFHTLYISIMCAQILGIAAAALTFSPKAPCYQVMVASLFIRFWRLARHGVQLSHPARQSAAQSVVDRIRLDALHRSGTALRRDADVEAGRDASRQPCGDVQT